jgi:hypothetical protein
MFTHFTSWHILRIGDIHRQFVCNMSRVAKLERRFVSQQMSLLGPKSVASPHEDVSRFGGREAL